MNKAKLVSTKNEAAGIKSFRFRLDFPFSFLPGQYVMVIDPLHADVRKPFSIVRYDDDDNEMTIAIKKNGQFTSKLFSSENGSEFLISGPYGRFILPEEESPLVFVAGGIGITPLYSMLLKIHDSPYSKKIYLFYSAKSRKEMALFDELIKLNDPRIKIKYFFTHDNVSVEDCFNQRVDSRTIKKHVPEFSSSLFYICGPSGMIQDLTRQFLDSGVHPDRIRSEDFG